MLAVFASATLFVFLSGFAVAQEDDNGTTAATGNIGGINRVSSQSSGSSQENQDLQVGVIGRFTMADVVEFEPFTEQKQTSRRRERLERRDMEGIANLNTGRGFLVAHIPPKNLIVIGAHLKALRGNTGNPDRTNAQQRELVTAAILDVVNELMEKFPQDPIFVLGDFNVDATDTRTNRTDLTLDGNSGSAAEYDETNVLLKDRRLVDDFQTKEALGR